MARIRSVKPEFWTDEDLADVSRDARLLYIGLWNLADEHGRLRGDPRYVKGQLFPYDDDLTAAAVDELLKALEAARKVFRYRADDRQYLFLPNLGKHQRLEGDKVPSKLPPPPCADMSAFRADESARGADKSARDNEDVTHGSEQGKQAAQVGADKSARRADESSLFYGTGSMEHVAGSMLGASAPRANKPRATSPQDAKRGTRLPDDFTVTDEMRAWYRTNTPDVDIALETSQFIDHFQAKSGKDALKSNWVAAWRTWMRNAQKWKTERTSNGRGPRASTSSHEPYRDKPTRDYHGDL